MVDFQYRSVWASSCGYPDNSHDAIIFRSTNFSQEILENCIKPLIDQNENGDEIQPLVDQVWVEVGGGGGEWGLTKLRTNFKCNF